MDLTGERLIAADRARLWAALNDPAVLARCIDGVETLTAATDTNGATRFDGTMNARVGPIRAAFAGSVRLTEVDPPNRYVLIGEGKGGVAGFAKGRAVVTLADATSNGRPATRLDYAVSSTVGGKLAQLGARLIEGTARGYADSFFTCLQTEVEAPAAPADVPPAAVAEPLPGRDPVAERCDDVRKLHGRQVKSGLTPLIWASVVVIIVLMVLVWQLS